MFKKILFATSVTKASDHAARVAFSLANAYFSHITIIHIIGAPARGFSYFVMDSKTNEKVEVNDDYFQWVKEEIKTYYSKYLDNLKSYDIRVSIGYPYREILRESRKLNPDIILLGGKTNKNYLIGSTVQNVSKLATSPVLVVNRPSASFWGKISNVVFVVDFSSSSDNAFQFVIRLINKIKGELRIFGVVDTWDINANTTLSQNEISIRLKKSMNFMREKYLSKARKSNCSDYFLDIWEGVSYIEIVKYARENYADLIVLSRPLNKKFDSSNTSVNYNIEQVVTRAGCPVVVLNERSKKTK